MQELIDQTLENYFKAYSKPPRYIILNERDANRLVGVDKAIRIKELVSFSYKGIPILRTPDLNTGKLIVT
jgi:hypothetical protein